MKRLLLVLVCCLPPMAAVGGVDTIRGPADLADAVIYSWENCDSEATNEDCRRYNAGGLSWLSAGLIGTNAERRSLIHLRQPLDSMPDSAHLMLYCFSEGDTIDRNIIVLPVLKPFIEGNELDRGVGNYPDPDSGVTWNHARLDHGDRDSVSWDQAGGDYLSSVACTVQVSGTNQWVAVRQMERVLAVADTVDGGFILINENSFPSKSSYKNFVSSNGAASNRPMLLLFYNEQSEFDNLRRRRSAALLTK